VNIAKLPEFPDADVCAALTGRQTTAPKNLIKCASDLYNLGRVARPFRCSSYFPIAPGILYKPVNPVRHRMIGILRCRGLLYPPFRKEHARVRVPLFAQRRWAGVEPAFRHSRAHGVVSRPSARKIHTISQPVVFQAWPCTPSALSVRPPVRLTETTAELGHSSGRTAIVGKASGPTKECGISVQNARRIAIVVEIVGLLHKPSLGILLSREVSSVLSHRG